jgi:hypothetical protein
MTVRRDTIVLRPPSEFQYRGPSRSGSEVIHNVLQALLGVEGLLWGKLTGRSRPCDTHSWHVYKSSGRPHPEPNHHSLTASSIRSRKL